ncbi:efflux transporter outer membrane subunit [Sandarakinorhabdus sp. DWP1-3-1]|uniref:efflux transporter outer membrane subunit n=1 Tax=Sandarakinorhabdus sp. DWP1-3-1 TaxID=2804627 RepID=UPI003CF63E3F
MRRLLLLALLLLSACVAPSLDAGRQPRAPETLGVASLSGVAAAWPGQGWWRSYGDPQLDALIAEALAGSPDIAAADARLHRAAAQIGQARAATLPSLDANGAVALNKQSYNNGIPAEFVPRGYNDTGRAALDFGYELDFWGRNRSAVRAATSDLRAAEADRASAALMLATSVATTYARLAQQTADRDVAVASIGLREQTLGLVRRRVREGLDTQGEEQSALAGVAAAREVLGGIDESLALTRNALAALLGAGPGRGRAITPPAVVRLTAVGVPAQLGADLIGRKPEIVAARWRVEAAARRIGVARADFYPNINLAAFIGVQSLGLSNLVIGGSDIGQVGPAIRLPIFDGGRRKANLRGAEADYALAVAQYDGALVQALQDVADAATSSRALAGRLTDARAALAAQEEANRIARLRYTGGLADYQSVLIAEDNVLQRRRLLADLQARAFTLDVALVRALGGGYVAPATIARNEVP